MQGDELKRAAEFFGKIQFPEPGIMEYSGFSYEQVSAMIDFGLEYLKGRMGSRMSCTDVIWVTHGIELLTNMSHKQYGVIEYKSDITDWKARRTIRFLGSFLRSKYEMSRIYAED